MFISQESAIIQKILAIINEDGKDKKFIYNNRKNTMDTITTNHTTHLPEYDDDGIYVVDDTVINTRYYVPTTTSHVYFNNIDDLFINNINTLYSLKETALYDNHIVGETFMAQHIKICIHLFSTYSQPGYIVNRFFCASMYDIHLPIISLAGQKITSKN